MSYVKPVSMETTLNYMYKTLKPGRERKIENFNGERKISVYRGKNYMNKITRKITSNPPMMFIRYMKNLGSKDKPELATQTLVLKLPKADILVYFNEAGDSSKGVLLNFFRRNFEPFKEFYDNLAALRSDKRFMDLLSEATGKDLSGPHLKYKDSYADQRPVDYGVLLKDWKG